MKIENVPNHIKYDQVQSKRLVTNGEQQVNILSLEKGSAIPSHSSTKDATIVILAGNILFNLLGAEQNLLVNDIMSFKADQEHHLKAVEDSKFLLIQ